ncbi:DEAD/DEAH box helicase family protein [Xylanibacter brevis]|uniref:DEAD/DEAH box helicase family protein n=1 Tax=Xylanibacter brevis TaxID=83231 RepID=UPI00048146D0|nr:DEAD/DEAH box helicase family protein [Xylanibacter brevis]
MFYKLIEKKRNEWLASEECTIKELLLYIIQRGVMRDAQLEAIKTYLFLKIACKNQPLWQLFVDGVFNDTNIGQMELTETARQIFSTNKAAVALFQYSRLHDKKGKQLAPELERYIKEHADEIDYEATFQKIFYGVTYTDYLFSLPMGAGKTYLMAAFIYLDLYYAQNEPDNPAFAHNFMVMAPSGLKSSIVPSLKHIKEFDPSWIIPEPSATELRRLIKFEILDEQKAAKKSNRIKNPNAQKINNHQPFEDLKGLVAITNAEKVILDRFDTDQDPSLFSEEELKRMASANELRELIGSIPNLAVYIDEVHHAADGEIKLRQVVNQWTEKHTFNSVLGFSGTPYLDSAEPLKISETLTIKNTDLANVVYYYPLVDGIGNFLKNPVVKFEDNDTLTIVANGVREFLDNYRDTMYANGTCAKLAIYCGQIETLEESIYPLVAEIVASYGLSPTDIILPYHGGNKQYPQHEGSETDFASLDTSISKYKIVLLVQIGKEGWDCKSLTGVILPQKGVCPTNMVLQTSCRCLRQVTKNSQETALIWLNKFNAEKLNRQLQQQQNITLKEFGGKPNVEPKLIDRFSRMERMQVPKIDYYQLKVSYETLIIDDTNNTSQRLQSESTLALADISLIHQQDMEGNLIASVEQENKEKMHTSFRWWLHQIAKESFGMVTMADLKKCEVELRSIFSKITTEKDGVLIENTKYNHQRVRSLIRQAFAPQRDFTTKEEILPWQACLLQIERMTSPIEDSEKFFPDQQVVHEIMEWDKRPPQQELTADQKAKIAELEALGIDVSALRTPQLDPHPERDQTYHYLPYRFDSGLERHFLSQEILPLIKEKALEVYFNGDDTLTDFKIDCYKHVGNNWLYIGRYVPDFILLSRNEQRQIDKVVIIETKGEGFAAKFKDRLDFMSEFVKKNNDKFGYQRFDFLYLEDTLNAEQRRHKTLATIKNFFNV